jgi:hypothetical protein
MKNMLYLALVHKMFCGYGPCSTKMLMNYWDPILHRKINIEHKFLTQVNAEAYFPLFYGVGP